MKLAERQNIHVTASVDSSMTAGLLDLLHDRSNRQLMGDLAKI